MVYCRVSADGAVETVDAPLTSDQVALLKRRCDAFAAFTDDAPLAVASFARSLLLDDPAPYLADLDLLVDAVDRVFGHEPLTLEDRPRFALEFTCLVGEYLRRSHGASWEIDATPFSATFGHYVVDVPLGGTGKLRLAPLTIADGLLATTPPRSLRAVLGSVGEQISACRRQGTAPVPRR